MSVTLTSIKEVLHDPVCDGDELECAEELNISNDMFSRICLRAEGVDGWSGNHDPIAYSPRELMAMASSFPDYEKALIALAKDGGAILS